MSTTPTTSPGPHTLTPPDESLWQRYSPHHEAPLSGVASVALHALAVALVLGVAALAAWQKEESEFEKRKKPAAADNASVKSLPVSPVEVGGGGGTPGGKDKAPGVADPDKDRVEHGSNRDGSNTKPPDMPPTEHVKLPPAKERGIRQEFDNDSNITKLVKRGTEASNSLFSMEKDVRQTLRKAAAPGRGQGGEGSDGGRDTGKDTGRGPNEGPGNAMTLREKRMLRWAMTFNTLDGKDYGRQLRGLGAIVAFPVPGDAQRFLLIKNLDDPKSAQVEDISGLNRIFWVDDKPQSVQSLCRALGVQPPPYFAAFFPAELEQRLLDVEMAYLAKVHGKNSEEDIHETKFDVINVGGKYDVRVKGLTLSK